VVTALALVGGGLLAGWPGLAVALVGVAAGPPLLHRLGDSGVWILSGTALLAATAYAMRPWADAAGWAGSWAWPHYLVLAVLCMGLAATVRRPGPVSRRRMNGSSTAR
jgi:arabinofuranan 3-O-arabinosyltransferase